MSEVRPEINRRMSDTTFYSNSQNSPTDASSNGCNSYKAAGQTATQTGPLQRGSATRGSLPTNFGSAIVRDRSQSTSVKSDQSESGKLTIKPDGIKVTELSSELKDEFKITITISREKDDYK